MIRYHLGVILLIEGALLTLPMLVAVIYGESILPFLITVGILAVIGLPCVIFKPKDTQIYARDGFICVASAWILMSAFGALPFVFSGAIPNYIDAFFETASGFTTTGASILRAVEPLPKGILFWRSFTHWIGGMGVLVFMLAILPSSGGQAMHLLRAETPGPTKGKLVPKMRQSAIILYGIYVVMTIILVVALLLCKLPLYDSLVTAFGTAGTGGFSVLNASIGGYNNPAAEWVIAVFMVLFGINFNLYYFMLIGKARDAFKSEELRVYLAIVALATIAITVNTVNTVSGLSDGIRTSFFQVASIISTSGFATVDYNLWSSFAKSVLLLLMITGACAGSTAGGLKISRVIILLKSIVREIKHMLNPRSVNVIRLDGKVIEDETTRSALGYLAVYITLIITSVLLLSFDGFGLETNLSATLACINNVGPGFDAVGPASNFADYSLFSKAILSVAMLIGRLEIMPMMILFTPFAWKKR